MPFVSGAAAVYHGIKGGIRRVSAALATRYAPESPTSSWRLDSERWLRAGLCRAGGGPYRRAFLGEGSSARELNIPASATSPAACNILWWRRSRFCGRTSSPRFGNPSRQGGLRRRSCNSIPSRTRPSRGTPPRLSKDRIDAPYSSLPIARRAPSEPGGHVLWTGSQLPAGWMRRVQRLLRRLPRFCRGPLGPTSRRGPRSSPCPGGPASSAVSSGCGPRARRAREGQAL